MAKGEFIGEFELCVLLAIAHLGPGAYGLAIRREIRTRAGRDPALGAVYATIGRLTDKGLLTVHRSAPRAVRGGRSRKTVELTPAGEHALGATVTMLTRLIAGWTPRGTPA